MPSNQHNKLPQHSHAPHPTTEVSPAPLRVSLADSKLYRDDTILKEGLVQRRLISYPSPSQENRMLRDKLMVEGLLLGQTLEEEAGRAKFMVPGSARPLANEGTVENGGPYTYGDSELFGDLGNLLGKVAVASPEVMVVLNESIGQNVALIEFTRVGDPKLLLVPGFELGAAAVENDDVARAFYLKHLYDEFGDRFNQFSGQFIDGFQTGITQENL